MKRIKAISLLLGVGLFVLWTGLANACDCAEDKVSIPANATEREKYRLYRNHAASKSTIFLRGTLLSVDMSDATKLKLDRPLSNVYGDKALPALHFKFRLQQAIKGSVPLGMIDLYEVLDGSDCQDFQPGIEHVARPKIIEFGAYEARSNGKPIYLFGGGCSYVQPAEDAIDWKRQEKVHQLQLLMMKKSVERRLKRKAEPEN